MLEKVQIKAMKNGPLVIEGKAEITDENGDVNETEGKMVALCRCGQSANKPFCDGSPEGSFLSKRNFNFFLALPAFGRFDIFPDELNFLLNIVKL